MESETPMFDPKDLTALLGACSSERLAEAAREATARDDPEVLLVVAVATMARKLGRPSDAPRVLRAVEAAIAVLREE